MGAMATNARDASNMYGAVRECSSDSETIFESTSGPNAMYAVRSEMAITNPRRRPKAARAGWP